MSLDLWGFFIIAKSGRTATTKGVRLLVIVHPGLIVNINSTRSGHGFIPEPMSVVRGWN